MTVWRIRLFNLSLLLVAPISMATAPDVPIENQDDSHLSQILVFDSKAKRLLQALEWGRFDGVKDLFFPSEPFLRLKAIARPLDYHQQLLKWYQIDLQKIHETYKGLGPLEFKGITGGGCKWKVVGAEANKIPYWSCYKRRINIQVGGKSAQITLQAMINWGNEWYITHLNPLPAP